MPWLFCVAIACPKISGEGSFQCYLRPSGKGHAGFLRVRAMAPKKAMKTQKTTMKSAGKTARKMLAKKAMKAQKSSAPEKPPSGAKAEYEHLNTSFLALLNKPWKDMTDKEKEDVIKNLPNPGPKVYRHMHTVAKTQGQRRPSC